MTVLANIIGGAAFGLFSRFGQLAIQKRNLWSNPGGHVLAMGTFGVAGYWAYKWELRAAEIIAEKKEELAERRRLRAAATEAFAAQQLAETE